MDASIISSFFYLLISGAAMSFAHCPLMCGPLAAVVSHPKCFYAGRLAGYAALCLLAHALGLAAAPSANARALLLFAAGLVLIFIAFALACRGVALKLLEGGLHHKKLILAIMHFLRSRSGAASMAAGALGSLLPCGIVYFYLAYAAAASSFAQALAAALALALTSSGALAATRVLLRGLFWRFLGPLLVAAQGVFLALKGLMLYE